MSSEALQTPPATTQKKKKSRKQKRQERNNTDGCKRPKKSKKGRHPGIDSGTYVSRFDPPESGKQGFIFTYNKQEFRKQNKWFAEEAINLLNQYVEKIHEADDKSYTFAQRQSGNPPLFIETDHPDPALLVDAIFRDFLTPPDQRIYPDVEEAATWYILIPVQVVCANKIDDIVKAGKELLKPILVEQTSPKSKKYNIKIHRNCFEEVHAKFKEEIASYVSSSTVVHIEDKESSDIELQVSTTGGMCCMSLLTNNEEFRGYSFTKIVNHRAKLARMERKREVEMEANDQAKIEVEEPQVVEAVQHVGGEVSEDEV